MACEGCGARFYYHERVAHPQAFCRRCASERGIVRICDTPGPDAAALSEKVVAEVLGTEEPAPAKPDFDQALRELATHAAEAMVAAFQDPERAEILQVLRRAHVPRGGGIVVFVLGGQRLPDDAVMDAVAEEMKRRDVDSFFDATAPQSHYVVPHGWRSRVRKIAAEEGLVAIADNLVEASPLPAFDVIAYVELEAEEELEPAAARAIDRWFDKAPSPTRSRRRKRRWKT